MKCPEIKNLLSEYIDQELTSVVRGEVKRHLDTCAACGAEYQKLDRAWDAIGELPSVTPEPGYVSRFWTRVALQESWQEKCTVFLKKIIRGKRFVPVATMLSLMLIVGSFNLAGIDSVSRDQAIFEDAEFIENIDVAEHLDTVKDLDSQEMEVVQDLDRLQT